MHRPPSSRADRSSAIQPILKTANFAQTQISTRLPARRGDARPSHAARFPAAPGSEGFDAGGSLVRALRKSPDRPRQQSWRQQAQADTAAAHPQTTHTAPLLAQARQTGEAGAQGENTGALLLYACPRRAQSGARRRGASCVLCGADSQWPPGLGGAAAAGRRGEGRQQPARSCDRFRPVNAAATAQHHSGNGGGAARHLAVLR